MIKEAIGTGATVELAMEAACAELGLESHEVEFEILEMPTKKTFGFFGKATPAKVRVYTQSSPADVAAQYLKDILNGMGLSSIEIEINPTENGAEFNLSGEDVGFVIGRRGETLDALQYLTGLVANHVENSYYRITINTGNYREKREKTLEALGRRMAIKAVKTGRNSFLEPMNPYERRIIHTAVQEIDGATSWSEGEDQNRYVVIGPDPKNPASRTGASSSRQGGYGRNGQRRSNSSGRPRSSGGNRQGNAPSQQKQNKTEGQPDRAPRKENEVTPLYGKIEVKNKTAAE